MSEKDKIIEDLKRDIDIILGDWDRVVKERDEARRWARAWKEAAINHRAWRHLLAKISTKYIRETVELRKQLEKYAIDEPVHESDDVFDDAMEDKGIYERNWHLINLGADMDDTKTSI